MIVNLNLTTVFLDAFGEAAVLELLHHLINTAVMVVKVELAPAAVEVLLTTPPVGVTQQLLVAKTQKFLSGMPATWPSG